MKVVYYKITVLEIAQSALNKTINPNPIGQRPPVCKGYGKSREIIKAILEGYGVGMITLRDIAHDAKSQKIYRGIKQLTIDGGHRIRAIRDYQCGRFDVDGVRYRDLTESERTAFDNFPVMIEQRVCTQKEAMHLFRLLNKGTPINDIEMIMSDDVSNIARHIRSTVHYYEEYDNDIHELFDTRIKNDNILVSANWGDNINPRGKHFELASVALLKAIAKGNTIAGLDAIAELVEDDLQVSSAAIKLKNKFLTDVLNTRNNKNRKITNDIFGAFSCVWFELYSKGKFNIKDYGEFSSEFYRAHALLTGNTKDKKYNYDTKVMNFSNGPKIVKEFARRAIKNYANPTQQTEVANLYLDHMDIKSLVESGALLILEDQVSVSRNNKFDMLARQGFVCALDGKPLDINDAIFGHDLARSLGGKVGDGEIIREVHNVDMGRITLDQYREVRGFDIDEVA